MRQQVSMSGFERSHVVTIVSNDKAGAALERVAADIGDWLSAAQTVHWLSPGIAADIGVDLADGGRLQDLRAGLRDRLAGRSIDYVVQPSAGRRKKLLLADMDSTLIRQECIDELADFVGLKEHVARITEQAMRGEIAFEPALRARVALLAGLGESVIAQVLAERISLMPGGRELVGTMRASGAYTALVSGGFTAFTGPVAAAVGFHENRANCLLMEAGRLNGRVAEPILGREAKLSALRELRERQRLATAETLAVGDGANDLGMIGEAGLGVAYHAKPAVAAAAGAEVNHGDLTTLLFFQGYAADEFVTYE